MSKQEQFQVGDLIRVYSPVEGVIPIAQDINSGNAVYFDVGIYGVVLKNPGSDYFDVCLSERKYRIWGKYLEKVSQDA